MEQIALMDFRGDEFVRLTTEDRIRQCHAFAEEARYQGTLADRDLRGDYIALAQHWSDLADELQKQAS
jgi:hypothetical protein